MKAMVLNKISSVAEKPLELVDLPEPVPGQDQILVKVSTCGVCHTELDEIEGRVSPSRFPMILGHEIVGRVEALGAGASKFKKAIEWELPGLIGLAVVVPFVSKARKICVTRQNGRGRTPMEAMPNIPWYRRILPIRFRKGLLIWRLLRFYVPE